MRSPVVRNAQRSSCPYPELIASLLVLLSMSMAGGVTARAETAPTVEELIRRHTEARGGRAAIEAVAILEHQLRIVEPTYTAEGVWRADRAGRMRIDVFIGADRVWTEGFDGKLAWQLPGGAERAEAADVGAASLRHSALLPTNILGLHEMPEHGARVEYVGREEVDGVPYHVIVLTLDDGFVSRYYLDPNSYLISRSRVRKALHPEGDPTPITIETVWSDFRTVAGVQFAYRSTDIDLATGKLLQTTTLLDTRVNPVADAALFQMRDPVRR